MITILTIIRTLLLFMLGFFLPKLFKTMGVPVGWRIGVFLILMIVALLSCSKEETIYKPFRPADRVMPVQLVELEK